MHRATQVVPFALASILCVEHADAATQDPAAGTPTEKPPIERTAPPSGGPATPEDEARALLQSAIKRQLGGARDLLLKSFFTELSLLDQRQGNIEGRLAVAFACGIVPSQDAIKVCTLTGDEVEISREGARYWISKKSAPASMPMTEAIYQKDKADLRRYSKMCRTLMHALSLAGLSKSLERPRATPDVEIAWFDGSRRKMKFVIEGLSADIGGLLAEEGAGEKLDPFAAPGEAKTADLAEVRLYFNLELELERIDVRRETPEHDAPWQAYRFLDFQRKDVGGRQYVWSPSEFRVYEGLPAAGAPLEHDVQVRLVSLRFNPQFRKEYFQKRDPRRSPP